MTTTIRQVLATMPSGKPGEALNFEELGRYLAANCDTDEDKDRSKRHAIRDELYRDGGIAYMKGVIATVFKDPDVQRLRQDWVEFARFNNPLKRIVNEVSTVYAEPAKRTVASGQDHYDALLEAVRFDEQMFQVGRLLNLHRTLLIGFRVRERPDGTRDPALDIASPATVRAILHPNDNTLVVGWLIRCEVRSARPGVDVPAWTLWTDHERAQLRGNFSVILDSYVEHGLGVCPWVPVALGPPCAGFWPGQEGEDLVAAHVSIWLTNVLLLKESKSSTKQAVVTGDGARMARDQAADSETPFEAPDGTSVSTIDFSMDLGPFRETANHILDHAANNYGLSGAILRHEGVQSAEARELVRLPLREVRKHQQVPLRRFEVAMMLVMASVVAVDLTEYTFDGVGGRVEFGESQTPLSGKEELDLFIAGRSAGVDDTVAFLMRRRPGMTAEEALAELEQHVSVELVRNVLMRPLQAISGSPGATLPAAQDAPDPTQAAPDANSTPPS